MKRGGLYNNYVIITGYSVNDRNTDELQGLIEFLFATKNKAEKAFNVEQMQFDNAPSSPGLRPANIVNLEQNLRE